MSLEKEISDAVQAALAPVLVELRQVQTALEKVRAVLPPALGTQTAAARAYGVSVRTVQRWVRDGVLRTVKVGKRTMVDLTSATPANDADIAAFAAEARG